MATKTVESLDLDNLGTVKLESGIELPIPKLTNRRVIQLAKLIADSGTEILESIDGYEKMTEIEVVSTVLSLLNEEQIAKLLNVALDINEDKALDLDFVDTLQLLQAFMEKSNIKKAFTAVQNMAKVFRKKNTKAATKAATVAAAK
ncbi:hypothetical protein NOM01_11005 [Sporolactobacillus sp. STSJ-5]|uniref:hypothetical protein n=1 Tax=Sporolactobacillus sp. STSJ-5 TaxID=2965076 RepID=UPI0021028292|nr:hypothetical protein [Sporolactobacillus sp. STSJ-5]MCQ2010544.1 hypothetical protein [Sporolactobacillus sp. STSJ-5]